MRQQVERLTSIKWYSGDWQHIDKWRVVMATLLQKCQHINGLEMVVQHISPCSVKDVIT